MYTMTLSPILMYDNDTKPFINVHNDTEPWQGEYNENLKKKIEKSRKQTISGDATSLVKRFNWACLIVQWEIINSKEYVSLPQTLIY